MPLGITLLHLDGGAHPTILWSRSPAKVAHFASGRWLFLTGPILVVEDVRVMLIGAMTKSELSRVVPEIEDLNSDLSEHQSKMGKRQP
jgi:hypothetical protein